MSYPDPRWYRSKECLRGDVRAFTWLVGIMLVLFLKLACVTAEPEPEGVSDWRRCAQECSGIFVLDFGTEPPGCDCVEVGP